MPKLRAVPHNYIGLYLSLHIFVLPEGSNLSARMQECDNQSRIRAGMNLFNTTSRTE